jgi:mRNA interferase MazF
MAEGARAARPLGRGDIVLVPFPFTDLSATKRRPAVVVWADSSGEDYVLAFISSRDISPSVADIVLLPTHPEFALTGLSVPSRIRTTKLVTLARPLLRRWLGRLGPLLIADLDRALVTALGINTVPYREEGRRDERARLIALHGAGGMAAVQADLGV